MEQWPALKRHAAWENRLSGTKSPDKETACLEKMFRLSCFTLLQMSIKKISLNRTKIQICTEYVVYWLEASSSWNCWCKNSHWSGEPNKILVTEPEFQISFVEKEMIISDWWNENGFQRWKFKSLNNSIAFITPPLVFSFFKSYWLK